MSDTSEVEDLLEQFRKGQEEADKKAVDLLYEECSEMAYNNVAGVSSQVLVTKSADGVHVRMVRRD